jgi:hypothetical protein
VLLRATLREERERFRERRRERERDVYREGGRRREGGFIIFKIMIP